MTTITVRLLIDDGKQELRSAHLHPKVGKAILDRLLLAIESGEGAIQAQLDGLRRGELPPASEPTN